MCYYIDRKINHTIINHTLCVMITKTDHLSPNHSKTTWITHSQIYLLHINTTLGKEELSLDYVNEFGHNIPLDSIISE